VHQYGLQRLVVRVAAANVAGMRESISYSHCEIYVLCRSALAELNSTAYAAGLSGALCSRITASHHKQNVLQLLHMIHAGNGSANLDVAAVTD
jgi:hypothetical protein